MLENEKIGRRIAELRKAKELTGEKFAELLSVSPQAISKWENGKCLPEASLLPALAEILETSIDSLLMPQELVILKAIFTDGCTETDVTRLLNSNINGNKLYISANSRILGVLSESDRMHVLAVTYHTPGGIFYDYAPENQFLSLDLQEGKFKGSDSLQIIGAYYGNEEDLRDCMFKMKHYDYFAWKEIHVNQENFPSSPRTDKKEYLTLIYTNDAGLHVISCEEENTLCFTGDRKNLYKKDTSYSILPGIAPLEWEKGMDCTWAGALLRALNYMGETYTYEQIMGMSGACYRIAFTEVWDWSAVDALVAFDYSTPLFAAVGYEQVWASRQGKEERGEERQNIMADIDSGKPVIAINLRIAPEWGVITGYQENGKILLCRTYFDKEFLNEKKDYLETDFWPFLITHFGKKIVKPSEYDILITSLHNLVKSFQASCGRGYYQGREAYEKWMEGLNNSALWDSNNKSTVLERRIGVNDATLLNLIDARCAASVYLKESLFLLPDNQKGKLSEIVNLYDIITDQLTGFRKGSKEAAKELIHYNEIDTGRNFSADFRRKQLAILKDVLKAEEGIASIAEELLNELKREETSTDTVTVDR